MCKWYWVQAVPIEGTDKHKCPTCGVAVELKGTTVLGSAADYLFGSDVVLLPGPKILS